MMHYTHLTKIKAHHIHPQSYMQTLNLRGEKRLTNKQKLIYVQKLQNMRTEQSKTKTNFQERERELHNHMSRKT